MRGSGFPYGASPVLGKDVARLYLRDGIFVFGSPTTVMYRSSLVRGQHPFYAEGLLHEDSEKCMHILEQWDFAFVPQVLSFLRTGNESISGGVRDFQPYSLDRYILVRRFASTFLEAPEADALQHHERKEYYGMLAQQAIRMRSASFWEYHRRGLNTIAESIDWYELSLAVSRELLWMAINPGATVKQALSFWNREKSRQVQVVDPPGTGERICNQQEEPNKDETHFSHV